MTTFLSVLETLINRAIARVVQGVAAAVANVTSLALVSAAFPDPKSKAWAIGIWTALACTPMAIGPTLGGFMVQQTGWRAPDRLKLDACA